jgi:holo-[acyl-carrier protein] synthase
MLRIGVDMIEVNRIRQAIDRHGERFFRRFFTAIEQSDSDGDPVRLAARFAAKEAAAKALGTGIGDVCWVDIEVRLDERGRPSLFLHDAAARLADELGLNHWQVSLSHTEQYAVAFVVAFAAETALGSTL